MYNVNFLILAENFQSLFRGFFTTIFICLISGILSFTIASVLIFIQWSKLPFFSYFVKIIINLVRNTPLLIQIYIIYKGLPQLNIILPPILCAIIALSIYTGVYMSDIMKAGLNTVQREQKLAALSLGMNNFQTFCYIIYPQTLRNVIQPLAGQFINMIKNSTLVSFIAISDIFYCAYKGMSDYFAVVEFMIAALLMYISLTGLVAWYAAKLEQKYALRGIV